MIHLSSTPRQLAAAIALAILASGCAHTQTRTFDSASADTRAEINARASRGTAVVTLTTGEQITSSTLRLDTQEVTWMDEQTGEPRTAPLAEVQAVRVHNRRSYVLRDLGIGLATGAATGFALGSLGGDPGFIFSRGDLQKMGLGAGALVGTGVGALIGYEEGRTRYVAPIDSASARRSSGGG